MSAHAYTENQLVEQPAIGLFAGSMYLTQIVNSQGRQAREIKRTIHDVMFLKRQNRFICVKYILPLFAEVGQPLSHRMK
jgi:hypothetical protein